MEGWIWLHRKIQESSLYQSLNSKQRDVMIQCLLMANHKKQKWEWEKKTYWCERGQFITSLDSITRNCGNDVRVQSVRTALLKLEKWGFLTNESTKTGRLITICKWETYQGKGGLTNKATNKELTKTQQRANKELTPNKNGKNGKNSTTTASEDADVEVWLSAKKRKLKGKRLDAFKLFWKSFGFPKSRAAAIDAWLDIPELTDTLVSEICKAAELEATERPSLLANGKTPKYAQGWISDRRWEDELIKSVAPINGFDADGRRLDPNYDNYKTWNSNSNAGYAPGPTAPPIDPKNRRL